MTPFRLGIPCSAAETLDQSVLEKYSEIGALMSVKPHFSDTVMLSNIYA